MIFQHNFDNDNLYINVYLVWSFKKMGKIEKVLMQSSGSSLWLVTLLNEWLQLIFFLQYSI